MSVSTGKRVKGFARDNIIKIISGARLHGVSRESSAGRAWREQVARYGVKPGGALPRGYKYRRLNPRRVSGKVVTL